MYKLTFNDCRCSPICDGVVSYYVDNLEEFESNWLREPAASVETINRYFRSKFGQITTDTWSDESSYNIVQEDKNSEIISETSYSYQDRLITTHNAYISGIMYHFDKLTIDLRKVKYDSKIILLAKYKAEGVAEVFDFFDHRKNETFKYIDLSYYGNPIAHYDNGFLDFIGQYHSNDKELFKETSLESFVWTEICNSDSSSLTDNNNIEELTDEQLAYLFWDIPGEAG